MKVKNISNKTINIKLNNMIQTVQPNEIIDYPERLILVKGFEKLKESIKKPKEEEIVVEEIKEPVEELEEIKEEIKEAVKEEIKEEVKEEVKVKKFKIPKIIKKTLKGE